MTVKTSGDDVVWGLGMDRELRSRYLLLPLLGQPVTPASPEPPAVNDRHSTVSSTE